MHLWQNLGHWPHSLRRLHLLWLSGISHTISSYNLQRVPGKGNLSHPALCLEHLTILKGDTGRQERLVTVKYAEWPSKHTLENFSLWACMSLVFEDKYFMYSFSLRIHLYKNILVKYWFCVQCHVCFGFEETQAHYLLCELNSWEKGSHHGFHIPIPLICQDIRMALTEDRPSAVSK